MEVNMNLALGLQKVENIRFKRLLLSEKVINRSVNET
jgi:hypothetical protein